MEIYDLTESYYRRQRYTIKQQVMQDFIPAEVHARYITLEKNKDVPHPWEYYPMLFIEEEQQHKEVLKEKELEAYKDARRAYISEFNRRRQGN